MGHGLRSSARRRCDLQGARERPARGSRLREVVGHGCDLQIGDGEIFRSGARARARSARGGGFCARRGRLGVAGGGWKSRKREQKERRVREHRREIFGKWFTENFSVNRFPNFFEEFSGQFTNDFRWLSFYSETNTRKWWKRFTENIWRRNKRSLDASA